MKPSRIIGWTVVGASVLACPCLVLGFVGEQNAAGQWRRWSLNPTDSRVPATSVDRTRKAILYRLDAAGSARGNAAAELDAVRSAFDQWQGLSGTVLRFEEGPQVNGTRDVNSGDGLNTWFWSTNLVVNGGRDNLSGVLALTYVASYSDGNVIFDTDTVLNAAQFRWSTDGLSAQTQEPFVEAIALHEIGHALGLRHSPVGGATMLYVGDLGVNSQVGLSRDEIAAARAFYGTAATLGASGRVTGTVRVGSTAVLGAAVFAETSAGEVVSGTVTRTNGTYELSGLDPGTYTLRAAPLDPAFAGNYLIRGADIAAAYRNAPTEFRPAENTGVQVKGGSVVTSDFSLSPGAPLRIVRLLRPSADLANPSYNNKPVSVVPTGQTLYIGVLCSSALAATDSVRLVVSGDGVIHGATEVRPNALGTMALAAVPVQFQGNASHGLRSLRLERGSDVTWTHGFLEVQAAVPDVNGDGLDDRFQRRYWTRFTRPEAAPAADPDADGFMNRWEFERQSDPTNRLSAHFEILSVKLSASGAVVRAETAPGKRFQLLRRERVDAAPWIPVSAPVLAAGPETDFSDPGATRVIDFYRVVLVFD